LATSCDCTQKVGGDCARRGREMCNNWVSNVHIDYMSGSEEWIAKPVLPPGTNLCSGDHIKIQKGENSGGEQ